MKNVFEIVKSAGVLFAASLSFGVTSAFAAEAPEATEGLLKSAETTYMRECASCHGVEGDGNGAAAYILNPKPRNFQLGVYKLRSTPNGEPPTKHDLFRTITNGVENSMMPAFKSLSESERWGLVHYVLQLGELQDEEPESIKVAAEPAVTPEGIERGKHLYGELKCDTCHGTDGWGDGPSSLTLENDAKEKVYPLNLTMGVYKGGAEGEQLFTRIATGLDGSPMPSYSEEATSEQIWDLVHYLQTLAKK